MTHKQRQTPERCSVPAPSVASSAKHYVEHNLFILAEMLRNQHSIAHIMPILEAEKIDFDLMRYLQMLEKGRSPLLALLASAGEK